MIVKRYDVFHFEELAPEVRAKVLDRERHVNVEADDWYRPIIEEWQARLEGRGYESARVLFSGFSSQGDGACFEATVNVPVWLGEHGSSRTYRKLQRACRDGEVDVRIHHAGRYYHEHSTRVEGWYGGTEDDVQGELDEVSGLIEAEKVELSREIYRALEREYVHRTSDNAVAETVIANAVLFHADGCAAHA